ncbi:MAG: hypothetical protein ABEJ67_06495 [Halanaeroarchaeum sp.]
MRIGRFGGPVTLGIVLWAIAVLAGLPAALGIDAGVAPTLALLVLVLVAVVAGGILSTGHIRSRYW